MGENKNNTTEINTQISSSDVTSVNDVVCTEHIVEAGTLLCEKYEVIEKMEVLTGEADLYICEYDNEKYVAKIYRRKIAIKDEIIQKLKDIDSHYVSRIYETDTYNGFPFEILPYYKNGSLQNKMFDFEFIKNYIIPCLNEGLNILHQNGIIHKDLKPSNIMMTDNYGEVAIIDFGISSIKNGGSTVIITHTGMTPEYSAPETFRNLYLEESDYYSLGITLYELFCGYTPYNNMNSEEIEQYVSIQKIPFPENMPQDLKDFISAVTYYDITNRKNKSNPNRRWTYEEVKRWCSGEKLPIPGEEIMVEDSDVNIEFKPYAFIGKKYRNINTLIHAFGENWQEGKKQVFRGLLFSFFRNINPEIAGYCKDTEEELSKGGNEDYHFFRLLYKLYPDTEVFYWKGKVFKNIYELGKDIFSNLLAENYKSSVWFWKDILNYDLISYYLENTNTLKDNDDLLHHIKRAVKYYRTSKNGTQKRKISYFLLAYSCLSEEVLFIGNKQFHTVDELIDYLVELLNNSYEDFENICNSLIDGKGNLSIRFESWLIALGKENELDDWKKSEELQLLQNMDKPEEVEQSDISEE